MATPKRPSPGHSPTSDRKTMSGTTNLHTGQGPATTVGVVVYARYYREAVLRALEGTPSLLAVDFGDGSAESLEKCERVQPEILLADLSNESLVAFVRHAHAAVPSTQIIALNRVETEPEILTLFECGLTGLVPHDAGREEILAAIRAALRGEFTGPPRVAAALVRRVNEAGEQANAPRPDPALSPRELQIVRHLELGLTNKEIANRLGIEPATVKNHVHHLLRKLSTHRRADAALKLRSQGQVPRVVRRLRPRRGH
jgi:two-component system, NarL family, nitrate/nitrite response regulator NarL